MKRVLLIRSNPVNPDPPVEKVADALLANGFEVTIVCWDRDSTIEEIENVLLLQRGRAKIVRFGIPAVYGGGLRKTLKALLVFQYRLARWLIKNKNSYDIIHAFDFDTGLIAKVLGIKMKKKLVYHILDYYVDSHGISNNILKKIMKKTEDSIINQSDCTIICSEKRREQIKGSYPKQLIVIHNTPKKSMKLISHKQSDNNERIKLVYVGILAQSRFLREIISVVMDTPQFEFHIGGFGSMEDEIKEFSKQCPRIIYYGKLAYEKTLELENECDIMLAIYDPSIPNHRYAAPNKFYESLMLGKPVVMASNTGFDEIIYRNNIGVLIDYSKEGLKKGLIELSAKDLQEMGRKSKKLYDNLYSWDLMEEKLIKMYKDLIL